MSFLTYERYYPWPVADLRHRLCADDVLWRICQPKSALGRHDVREATLEDLAGQIVIEQFSRGCVKLGCPIGETLALGHSEFPARAKPDIVIELDNASALHICELKSSRTDYSRFDRVFDSRGFQEYLATQGHDGSAPWEVEQDLIKLRLFAQLSERVKTCVLVIVDAYAGRGRSWTKVFSDPNTFASTMKTNLVRSWANELLGATTIEHLKTKDCEARFITCLVHPKPSSLPPQ